eukprot:TRINITY_DN9107_c0_g1_i1.p1 TRINITY_DN9107_c0_g1~~TRINITY_DN9107_c0_g1_i1.p1  ORF type:complete len:718 (-),score=91.87 TRINITY_DN9107_c0_g1_i1:127-2004(-)
MKQPDNFRRPAVHVDNEAAETEKYKRLLLADASFAEHIKARETDYPHYLAVTLLLLQHGVDLGMTVKARLLAAAWHHHDWSLASYLLGAHEEQFGLVEVLRAVRILDAPRKAKGFERRIARLEKQSTAKPRTVGLVRAKLTDLKAEVPGCETQNTSVTGALSRRICKWASGIPAVKLQFYALQLPREPWQELADIVHLAPSDFALAWFLPFVFGTPPPADSLAVVARELDTENCVEVATRGQIPYSYVRKNVAELSDEAKGAIAEYEKLDTLIWYYEELQCPALDAAITQRLDAGQVPQFSYGKLMERLLYFKSAGAPFYYKLMPIAEERLRKICLPLENPVVVLGDASYSMDVAIRTATIIGSLLAVLTKADLKFFNVELFAPAVTPRTVAEVLDCATTTRADGLTAPACSLWEYYTKKTPIKFFVVVTDEIENEPSQGSFFAQLFYRYYTEVYPAKIVFVSFLENPLEKERMVKALEHMGIIPLQFRLDARRPDLTKVDTLLGLLASECSYFAVQAHALAKAISAGGPDGAFQRGLEKMKDLPSPEQIASKEKEDEDEAKSKGKKRADPTDEDDIPEDFLCPITTVMMEDPVCVFAGFARDAHVCCCAHSSSTKGGGSRRPLV